MEILQNLLNPWVAVYVIGVFAVQLLVLSIRRWKRESLLDARRRQGLPDDQLLNPSDALATARHWAVFEAFSLIVSIVAGPVLILAFVDPTGGETTAGEEAKMGLSVAMVGFLLWALVNFTDVAKAFLGGLAFRTLAAFTRPFQVGDRVNLKGVDGKIESIGIFFISIGTVNDDLIHVPTAGLWSEVLTSVNAGKRSSLCVMQFYLAPSATRAQQQSAEDAIWDAIQSSTYFEPARPMQIFLNQTLDGIQLTAKAYVCRTYDEPLFTTDVTRAFLDHVDRENIPLSRRLILPPPA